MGIQDLLIPDNTQILTANEDGQPLQVNGRLCHLYMAVSHTLVFHLYSITVVRNLSHPLNLGGIFFGNLGPSCASICPSPRSGCTGSSYLSGAFRSPVLTLNENLATRAHCQGHYPSRPVSLKKAPAG